MPPLLPHMVLFWIARRLRRIRTVPCLRLLVLVYYMIHVDTSGCRVNHLLGVADRWRRPLYICSPVTRSSDLSCVVLFC